MWYKCTKGIIALKFLVLVKCSSDFTFFNFKAKIERKKIEYREI